MFSVLLFNPVEGMFMQRRHTIHGMHHGVDKPMPSSGFLTDEADVFEPKRPIGRILKRAISRHSMMSEDEKECAMILMAKRRKIQILKEDIKILKERVDSKKGMDMDEMRQEIMMNEQVSSEVSCKQKLIDIEMMEEELEMMKSELIEELKMMRKIKMGKMGSEGSMVDSDLKKKGIAAHHLKANVMKSGMIPVDKKKMIALMSELGDNIREFISKIIDKLTKEDPSGKVSEDTMRIIEELKKMGMDDSEISPEIIEIIKKMMKLKAGLKAEIMGVEGGLEIPYTSKKTGKPLQKVPYTDSMQGLEMDEMMIDEMMGMEGGLKEKIMGLKGDLRIPYTSTKSGMHLKVPYTESMPGLDIPYTSKKSGMHLHKLPYTESMQGLTMDEMLDEIMGKSDGLDIPYTSKKTGMPLSKVPNTESMQGLDMDEMLDEIMGKSEQESLIPKSARKKAIKLMMMHQLNDLSDIDKEIESITGKDDSVMCEALKKRVIEEILIVKQDILDLEDMLPGELSELMDVKRQLLSDMAKVKELDEDCPMKIKKLRTIKRKLIMKKKEEIKKVMESEPKRRVEEDAQDKSWLSNLFGMFN